MMDKFVTYSDGVKYWENISADVNGMLGGFPMVSNVDLKGSRAFIAKQGIGANRNGLTKAKRILEGGAGIGRITCNLLADIGDTIDVIEPVARFTAALKDKPFIGTIYNCGLQQWFPTLSKDEGESKQEGEDAGEGESSKRYDLVWIQWCAGHLTDIELVAFLQRCAKALVQGDERAMIFVKENVVSPRDVYDENDCSVTRTIPSFGSIFDQAGLQIVDRRVQNGFPEELCAVMMWALKPKKKASTSAPTAATATTTPSIVDAPTTASVIEKVV